MKIGITGSLSSGKTTASKILSAKRGPLFNADKAVRELYQNRLFQKLICRKFKIKNNKQIKKTLRELILEDKNNIKKLEKTIHPLVREKMKKFTFKNKNKKLLFYEVPLLIESKLMKRFDLIIFIKAKKKIRMKRFMQKRGDAMLFNLLNNKQIQDNKKAKHCDYVVVNEKNFKILKKNLSNIMNRYE